MTSTPAIRSLTPCLLLALAPLALGGEADLYAAEGGPLTAVPIERDVADALVAPGQAYQARVRIENRSDVPQHGRLALTLLDLWERPCGATQTFAIDLPPVGRSEVAAAFAPPRLGVFKVRSVVESLGRLRACDVASFGCVPTGSPPKHPFLGAHVNMAKGIPELGRSLGFSANRAHDMTQFTWWQRLEPERGQWDHRHRATAAFLTSLGYDHWGEWMATPHWAVTLPDGSHPARHDGYPRPWVPTDAEALRTYVRTSLEMYPGIREWEVWNEPNVSGFWAGSPADYAALAKTVYAEAKRVRPDITVYVQFGADGPWYRDAAKAGLLDHADGISFHAYATAKDHPQAIAGTVAEIRAALAKHGREGMPIVDSEGGLAGSSFLRGLQHAKLPPESGRTYDFLQAAERIVQWRVVMMAAGVKAHYYYMHAGGGLDRDAGHRWSLVDAAGGPTPAGVAQNQFAWQLDGGAFRAQVARTGDARALRTYLFERRDGAIAAVLWAEDGARYRLPRTCPAFDLMGAPLDGDGIEIGPTPVYLRPAGDLAAATAALSATATVITAPAPVTVQRAGAPEPRRMNAFSVANELGMKRLIPLDLGPAATMGLADAKAGDGTGGWFDEGPYNDLSMIAQGRHEWLGVPFHLGRDGGTGPCVAVLRGKTFPAGPATAGPVAVGRAVRGLFFCHAANWSWKPGITVATYALRFADGSTLDLPVITDQNIGDWWRDQQDGEDCRTVPFLCQDPLETRAPYRFLRIWYWENPRADVALESITIRSGSGDTTFATAAITAAVW